MRVLIEAAIDSLAAAKQALAEGADRLELCSNIAVGGLTPTAALVRQCLTLGVPCMAMARPRAGDFVYGGADLQQLMADVAALRAAGVQGIVFGVLTRDHTVDHEALTRIVKMCSGMDAVFHRAFDGTPNVSEALDTLISCGVTRVLTSGQAAIAAEGVATLAALTERAAGRIQILPGGGIRAHNVAEIVRRTGVTQIHARGTEAGVIIEIRQALQGLGGCG